MAQGIKADQRQSSGGGLKGVRIEHPAGNKPLFASVSDQTKMAFAFCVLLPENHAPLPVQRMIGITDLGPRPVTMGSMLSLCLAGLKQCLPILPATPIASPFPTSA